MGRCDVEQLVVLLWKRSWILPVRLPAPGTTLVGGHRSIQTRESLDWTCQSLVVSPPISWVESTLTPLIDQQPKTAPMGVVGKIEILNR